MVVVTFGQVIETSIDEITSVTLTVIALTTGYKRKIKSTKRIILIFTCIPGNDRAATAIAN